MNGFSTNRNRARVENRGSGPGASRRRSSAKPEMRGMQVCLPKRVRVALKTEAARRDMDVSTLCRDALDEWLAGDMRAPKRSALENGGGVEEEARLTIRVPEDQRKRLRMLGVEWDMDVQDIWRNVLEPLSKEFRP